MSTTIESLELEINSNSTQAVSGIDALSSSLSKLKNAVKGGVGLTSVANQVRNLNAALSAGGSSAEKIDKLAVSLAKLSSLGKIKISASIGNQIKNIGSAASSLEISDYEKINELTKALNGLNDLGKASGLRSVITQLNHLPDLAKTFSSTDIDGLCNDLYKLSNALSPLAGQANSVSNAFSKLPTSVNKLSTAVRGASSSNHGMANSAIDLYAKFKMAYNAVRIGAQTIGSWITKSNEYIEDVNLFTASMGEYASEAQKYAEQVGELMGIDPGQFMRYEGVFNTIIKGFGVASDRAYIMSKNLTQLGYDLSSFYNISFEDSMQKLQSGIAGELEPLRRLGYDLSQARLQQEAFNLGIEKSVSDMTQAEKSQLRYYAIMTQVTVAQGDMARTLKAPANQVRILQAQVIQCARALGNIFIPVLNAVLPYAIALAKAFRMIATEIANFFGFELPEVDYSSLSTNLSTMNNDLTQGSDAIGDLADGADDTASGLGEAGKKAKELSKYLLKFDELNVIPSQNDSDSGSGSGGRGKSGRGGGSGIGGPSLGSDLGFDLPQYDFLQDLVDSKSNQVLENIKKHLKDILSYLTAIGAALAAWKISKGVMDFLNRIKEFKGFTTMGNLSGLLMFIGDIVKLKRYVKDIADNGLNFYNAAGVISSFVGMLGDSFTIMGNYKVGGVLKIVQGVGEIIATIADWKINGFSSNTALTALEGLGDIVTGIGILHQNWLMVGTGIAFTGLLGTIRQLDAIVDAVKTGDWSEVDKVALVVNTIQLIGGIAIAMVAFHNSFQKMPTTASDEMKKMTDTVDTVSSTSESLSTSTSGMSNKLKDLSKELGWGLLIIGEVAAATLMIVGAIALLGFELQAVNTAWQPVLENGATVSTAMLTGAVLLAGIGAATALIGKYGGVDTAANIAIGTAILVEVSAATDIFVGEIIILGMMLQKVIDEWEPVNENKDLVVDSITTGTLLLTAVGVATAALGGISIATAGTLPIAIAIGTAVLLETSAATDAFVEEITDLGTKLQDVIDEWKPVNDDAPTVTKAIETGTDLLTGVGTATAKLGGITILSVGTLPIAIGIGTAMLGQLTDSFIDFTDNLIDVANQLSDRLAPNLEDLNDKLPGLSRNMSNFTFFMSQFAGYVVIYSHDTNISGFSRTVSNIIGFFTDDPIESMTNEVKKVGDQIRPLNDKLNEVVPDLQLACDLLTDYQNFLGRLGDICGQNGDASGLSLSVAINMQDVGRNLVAGLVTGIQSKSADLEKAGSDMIAGLQQGWGSGNNNLLSSVQSTMAKIKNTIGKPSDWSTPKGADMVSGMQNGWNSGRYNFTGSVNDTMDQSKSIIGTPSSWSTSRGRDMISGMRNGWNSGRPNFASAVSGAMDDSKRSIGTPSDWTEGKGEDMVAGLRAGFNATSDDFVNLVGGLTDRLYDALSGMWDIGHSAIASFINGLTSIHIPSPKFDWNWRQVGPVSIPTFWVHWNAAGGLFTKPTVMQGFGEAGDEAAIPLENKRAVRRIAGAIADNGGIAARDDGDLEEVIIRAMATVMQTYANDNQVNVYAELKMEDDEVLARHVAKGQRKLEYRMNPVGVTG
jgi:hypothetical protein